MGSSGWMGDECYDRMEAEARAKKPQDRTHQEVCFLDSIDEMRQNEREARHPVAWAIARFFLGIMFGAPVLGMLWGFYLLSKDLYLQLCAII